MLEKLYNAIRRDASPAIIKVENRPYADKKLYEIETPCPKPLCVSTLTGLTDYLNTNVDDLERGKLLCHVEGPDNVAIRSALMGDFKNRACYIRAELDQIKLPFNNWLDAEPFNISLQACLQIPTLRGPRPLTRGLS